MPRFARLHAPGQVHHVISRFVDRRFRLRDDRHRREFLKRLAGALDRYDWRLLAYALMGSHVHLVMVAGEARVGDVTRAVNTGFANWINARERRLGPVFAARPTVVVVAGAATARVVAYVHNNPVRAGVVDDPGETSWTSHRAYVGTDEVPAWLDVGEGLRLSGYDGTRAGREGFDAHVQAQRDRGRDAELSGNDGRRSRRLVRAALGTTVEVASPVLRSDGGEGLEHAVQAREGATLRCRWPGSMDELLRRVSEATSVRGEEIRGRDRRRRVVRARRLVVLAAVGHLGRTLTEVAAVLGISVQSASRLFHRGGERAKVLVVARAIGEACWVGTDSPFHLSLPEDDPPNPAR